MPFYRKRPVTVEAIELTRGNAADVVAWITAGGGGAHVAAASEGVLVYVETLEGVVGGREGDHVIRGTKGEHYPVKPDIFAQVYEGAGGEPGEPAQAAFAAYYGHGTGGRLRMPESWDMQPEGDRADWEAAARAATGGYRAALSAMQAQRDALADALRDIRDSQDTGTAAHDVAHAALDQLDGGAWAGHGYDSPGAGL